MTTKEVLGEDNPPAASTAARLRRWISSGPCQSPSGAFVAWYDLDAAQRSYDYPEITGYALTYLAGHETQSKLELAAGYRSAEWLLSRVSAGNLAARDGWDNNAVYLFDLGVIASGLLSFGRQTQDARFIAAGLELVDFLENELRFARSVSPISARGNDSERRAWSARGRAHLAKIVQAFLLAKEFDRGEAGLAELLVETAKSLQYGDGRFATDVDQRTTMLHPHLYAAEGLWIWGSACGDADCLERARAAVDWTWSHQLASGGFPRSVPTSNGDPGDEQSDVTGQAVRLALLLGSGFRSVDRAVRRLIEVTRGRDDALAIVYRPGSRPVHLNTWATLFAAQALTMAVPPNPVISWRQLV